MLKIGEFSKLCYVSVRMLRHFEELGLLAPQKVDPFSGYRYYTADQLIVVSNIVSLQRMGLSLSAIRDILSETGTPESFKKHIEACYQKKLKEAEKLEFQLKQLESAGERLLRKEEMMKKFTIIAKEMPERKVASLRDIIPVYTDEGRLWARLNTEIAPQRPKLTTPPLNTAIYHNAEYTEKNPDVEVQIAVVGNYKDTQNVRFIDIPKTLVASVTFSGSLDQITDANIAAMLWIEENGYHIDGVMFIIYHKGPGDTKDSEKWVTECCFPISISK